MSGESIYKRYKPAVAPEPVNSTLTYWFVFYANKLLIKVDNPKPGVTIPQVKNIEEMNIIPVRKQYLGTLQGQPCYTVEAASEDYIPEGMCYRKYGSLCGVLDEDIFLVAGKALQIVKWDQTHQYCGRCGVPTQMVQNERAKICPQCGLLSYPRLSPVVITAILRDNRILLVRHKILIKNIYSLVAGFVEPGETLEEALKREVNEEVGIELKNIKYFKSQPWPFPHSLMIGFTAEYASGEIIVDGVEIAEAEWFDARRVQQLPLPVKNSIAWELIDWYICNYADKT
jgi:NAD+ diphosphatase